MNIRYDSENGFEVFDREGVIIDDWKAWLEAGGKTFTPDHVEELRPGQEFKLYFDGGKLLWHWNIEQTDERLCLRSSLHNRGETAYQLGKANILDAAVPSMNMPDHDIAALGSLPGACGQSQRPLRCVKAADAPRQSMVKFQYVDRSAGRAMQVGFLTFRNRHTISAYTPGNGGGVSRMSAYCDFAGWQLEAGAETAVETFTVACGNNPCRQLEEWADLAAGEIKPEFCSRAALGWGGSAWAVAPKSNETREERTLGNAAALQEKLGAFGFEFVWISIRNLQGGNPGAWLEWNYENFPDGLDELVRKLSEYGLKLGLWCGPFYLSSALTERVRELDAALLRNDDGSPLVVCKVWSHGDAGKLPPAQRPSLYALDPTHPKTQAFIRKTFEFYRQHGVRYFMLDFLEAGGAMLGRFPYGKHHDSSICIGPEALNQTMAVIREAAGKDTFLLGCTGPTLHCAGYVDAMRIGGDFGEGRAINPEAFFYPASYVMNGIRFWTGPGWALRNMAANYYTHRKLYLNDSGNVLTVDQPIPLEDARIHATIHGFSGASSMLGDDLRYIRPGRLALIKKTLPRSPEVAFPVDLFSLPDNEVPRVFRREIHRTWGSWHVYAIFNLTGEAMRYQIGPEGEFVVWEFWNERYYGQMAKSSTLEVPAGTVRVFRTAPTTGRPQVLGSDLHLSMGEMEVKDCIWNEAEMSLELFVTRPRGEDGNVFIHVPPGLFIRNPADCFIAKDANDNSLILRLPCDFTGHEVCRKKIYFGKIGHETKEPMTMEEKIEKFA